jgi:ABC-2 type transport system permease protein
LSTSENTSVEELRENFAGTGYYAVLYIAHIVPSSPSAVQLLSDRQVGMNIRMHIANAIEKELERQKLAAYNIENLDEILTAIKTSVNIGQLSGRMMEVKRKVILNLQWLLVILGGFLIYFFIFLFGAQVMRGVIEEKSSRVVEILVSSVKPFQLMLGQDSWYRTGRPYTVLSVGSFKHHPGPAQPTIVFPRIGNSIFRNCCS